MEKFDVMEIAEVKEQKNLLDNAIASLNAVINGTDAKAIETANVSVNTELEKFNETVYDAYYRAFASAENPMLKCLEVGYLDTHKAKISENSETHKRTCALKKDKVGKLVDILGFEDYIEKGMFCANGQWSYKAEKLAKTLNREIHAGIGGDTKAFDSSYRIAKSADTVKFSNTAIAKQIQEIIDGIIFESVDESKKDLNKHKVLACDVRFIKESMSKTGRGQSLKATQGKTMIALITKVAIRIVTNSVYGHDFAKNQAKKS